jgi:hypothetical protein
MRSITFRKLLFLNLVAISLGVGIASNRAFGESPSKKLSAFDQQMLTVEKQFIQSLRDKNVAYADRAVAPDFQGVALNGNFFDRSELIDDARNGISKDVWLYEFTVVRLGDNCAVVSYSEIVPGDRPRYRHVSDTWAKENGEWRLKFQHRTPKVWSAMDLD